MRGFDLCRLPGLLSRGSAEVQIVAWMARSAIPNPVIVIFVICSARRFGSLAHSLALVRVAVLHSRQAAAPSRCRIGTSVTLRAADSSFFFLNAGLAWADAQIIPGRRAKFCLGI